MECALALHDSYPELPAENVDVAVVWHLEIVDTRHDRREVVVRRVWRLAWLAHNGEHGCKVLEAWATISNTKSAQQMVTYPRSEVSGCQ
jgi:hypothetical protein